MTRILIVSMALLLLGCSDGQDIQKYNDTVVGTYNNYMQSVGEHLSVIGYSAAETDNAVAFLQPLTDSCLAIMQKTQPLKKSADFHQKITNVYVAVKNELLPAAAALGKLQAVEDSTGAKDAAMHQSLIQDFNKANEHLKELKAAANEAHVHYTKTLGIQIK